MSDLPRISKLPAMSNEKIFSFKETRTDSAVGGLLIVRAMIAAASAPIGRLIQKQNLQPGPSVSTPPSKGPITAAVPKVNCFCC